MEVAVRFVVLSGMLIGNVANLSVNAQVETSVGTITLRTYNSLLLHSAANNNGTCITLGHTASRIACAICVCALY